MRWEEERAAFVQNKMNREIMEFGEMEKASVSADFSRDGSQMPPEMGVEKNGFHVNF